MWEIYDELISAIPKDVEVEACLNGQHWILVRSKGVGMAMVPKEGDFGLCRTGRIAGFTVEEISKHLKSWNFHEAAIGLAAVNSIINVPQRVETDCGISLSKQPAHSVFEFMKDRIKGKKVAVIGHFRDLEQLAPLCRLTILERKPQEGDLPDPACEFILPEQDFVFITATTLINKTLPRLLELSKNAFVVLVGPSTPMTPLLFKYGIDMLAGTVVTDPDKVWTLIQEGGQHEFFHCGSQMVKVENGK